MCRFLLHVYDTLKLPKKASEFPEISKGFSPKKAGHIESPLQYLYPLVETNLSQQPPVQLVVCYKPSKGLCYCSPQRAVSQAFLLVRYKAVLLESSFLDSSACSFIYFCTASSVILPIVST